MLLAFYLVAFFHSIESKRNTFQKSTSEGPLGGMTSALMCSSLTALALSTASILAAVLLCFWGSSPGFDRRQTLRFQTSRLSSLTWLQGYLPFATQQALNKSLHLLVCLRHTAVSPQSLLYSVGDGSQGCLQARPVFYHLVC